MPEEEWTCLSGMTPCANRSCGWAGGQLRVAIRPGTGTGPPLLLCNGVGMRLEALRPFVDALDPAIEVIRFDPPGAGRSQLPNLPYRFTTLALLLREMLHNLGHQQADVLGISWGGGLAQQFALLNPRGCRRLILVATSTGPQTMVPPNPLPPVKNLILRRWGDLWGGSAKTDPDALARALHKARISPLSLGYLYQNTAALGFTTLPLLPLIRQRTLVLTGDQDPIIPVANGRILAAGIPHATLHVYHGGHVELVTRPSLLTPLITSFLAAPPHDAQAAQATADADALAEALQVARAAQQAAEPTAAAQAAAAQAAAAQAAAALRDVREQAAAAREQAATEGASALCAGDGLTEELPGHDLSLADHGDAASGHHQTAGPVMVLVHPDRGPLLEDDVLVQDGVLDHGAPADAGIVHDHGPVHPGRAVHPDSGRQHRVAYLPAGDDDPVADHAVDRPSHPARLVVHELGRRVRRYVGQDRPLAVVEVERRVDRAQVHVRIEVGVERPDFPPVTRVARLGAGHRVPPEVIGVRGALPDQPRDDVAADAVPAVPVLGVLVQRLHQHVGVEHIVAHGRPGPRPAAPGGPADETAFP